MSIATLLLEHYLKAERAKKVIAGTFAVLLFLVAALYGGSDRGIEPDHVGCNWDGCD